VNETHTNASQKPKLRIGFGIGLGEYSSAIILGLATGIAGAIKTIHDQFNHDFNNSKAIKEKTKAHAAELDSIMATFHDEKVKPSGLPGTVFTDPLAGEQGVTMTSIANNPALHDEMLEKLSAEKNRFRLVKEQWRLHRWGVRDGFVQGTIDMVNMMMKPVKTIEGKRKQSGTLKAIIVNSTISAAVGAVMTLGFFNGMATRAKLTSIDNAVEPDLKQPPDMKTKPYKDRDPLPEPESTSSKTAKAIKASREALDQHEKPASHVDKLVTESSEHKDVQVAAR
jgi:hypothetical protein